MLYRYATKDLSINNAQAFVKALNATDGSSTKNSVILYAVLGNTADWVDEPEPSFVLDTEQNLQYEQHRRFIGAKKIDVGSVSHVVPRYDWGSGTVYSMYRDTDSDMFQRQYYVLTDQYNVYKCLYNNKGSASTVKPTGFSTLPFTTSDGYSWKYLYTISLGEADKFLTSVHMPVKTIVTPDTSPEQTRQQAVQNAAVNGAIEIVETVNLGSGYHQVANAVVEVGGRNTLKISGAGDGGASPIQGFYNGASVYISSGTGVGQLRRIVHWSGSTKTLTVNTSFSTTPNTDSRVIISPTVTIIGDGSNAQAYSRVNPATGSIANVSVISVGSQYTRAKAIITSNSIHGSGATANAVISPVGGHGSNPVRELAADKILLNVQFNGSEGVSATGAGYIPSNTEFRTLSILKDPVLKVNSNNVFVEVEAIANTSNSPSTLRFTTRATISYTSMDGNVPVNALVADNIITNERNRLAAEIGTLEFVTTLGSVQRKSDSLSNALQGANAHIVYIREDETQSDSSFYNAYLNSVQSYSNHVAFTKDDILLNSASETPVATIEAIVGPEANTFSGEILYTENIRAVSRTPEQIEDIKIILDF
jgi:hypothetical protein|tara:strand:+ start:5412 stop:7190 length:1779 start_codon:yes stop_codon:yes gene_type:complete